MIKCNKEIMQVKRTHLVKRVMLLRNIDLQELTLSFFIKMPNFQRVSRLLPKRKFWTLKQFLYNFFAEMSISFFTDGNLQGREKAFFTVVARLNTYTKISWVSFAFKLVNPKSLFSNFRMHVISLAINTR